LNDFLPVHPKAGFRLGIILFVTVASLISCWKTDPLTAENIVVWRSAPPRPAQLSPFPADLPAGLGSLLRGRGIAQLYSHQARAWEAARRGENLVLATGTASGKTLGYNLPVLASLLETPVSRALYLFPTKALAQDQFSALGGLLPALGSGKAFSAGIYDGDTPQGQRKALREKANLILSNPDMLHTGILPHHTNWAEFFRNLRFVIIDEMHTYRGVFGAHVANVLRRLKRVAAFYGAHPQFLLASATIGNPRSLAEKLIEAPVFLVDIDGSARGERHFLVYNPPVVEESLGLRKSSLLEAVRLAQDLLREQVQGVVFARTRRSVEILLNYLQDGERRAAETPSRIRGYRSGYLPGQRREIEQGLRDGSVRAVVATNALELGIDIGGLGAALLVGYPGSIASLTQQAGRAGRGEEPALALLIASPNPLDQFLAHHPDYLAERSPEQALLDPDHLLILLNHLRCAMFELPFEKGQGFGSLPASSVQEILRYLAAEGQAHESGEKFYWMSDSYPAAGVSLRSASPERVVIQTSDDRPVTVGEVDLSSALWMAHPKAIYMHEARQYYVHDLDLEKFVATVTEVALDYYTEPVRETSLALLQELVRQPAPGGEKGAGEVNVSSRVIGFKKIRWFTRENLGQEPLDLPPTEFQTTAYWLGLAEETVKALSLEGLWTNAPNEYGPEWPKLRERVRARDGYCCQVCGAPESGTRQHDVHHKIPFRAFRDESGRILREQANHLGNLVTLCQACHRQAEQNVRVRSGLAGLGYVLAQLAPLFLMCDPGDLGLHIDAAGEVAGLPAVILYDQVPGGIGFSQRLFEIHADLARGALEVVQACSCADGCPSCVGPGGENGLGGKQETLAILRWLFQ
jgi:DEAD/DEAH box helicase domain-containing protein